jgi:hypothetical protein
VKLKDSIKLLKGVRSVVVSAHGLHRSATIRNFHSKFCVLRRQALSLIQGISVFGSEIRSLIPRTRYRLSKRLDLTAIDLAAIFPPLPN